MIPGHLRRLRRLPAVTSNSQARSPMTTVALIGHRPWVAPQNYMFRLYPPVSSDARQRYKQIFGIDVPPVYTYFLFEVNGAFCFGMSLCGMPESMLGNRASRHGPRVMQRRGLATKRFRGSIARRLISLSMLRRGGYPPATQVSLPAAGPALPDGIGYPQGSLQKGFKFGLSSFPELLGAIHLFMYFT
jgi:hypothetical protein